MSRSVWKGPFIKASLFDKLMKTPKDNEKAIKVYSRASTILPMFVRIKVSVHYGKGFKTFVIKEEMIGHKFGEFALTRTIGKRKKKTK